MIVYLPPDSATMRAVLGPPDPWGLAEHLLAVIADALHGANWQRGGGKGKRPKPIPRPGVGPETDEERIGGHDSALPLDEMAEWLGWDQP